MKFFKALNFLKTTPIIDSPFLPINTGEGTPPPPVSYYALATNNNDFIITNDDQEIEVILN